MYGAYRAARSAPNLAMVARFNGASTVDGPEPLRNKREEMNYVHMVFKTQNSRMTPCGCTILSTFCCLASLAFVALIGTDFSGNVALQGLSFISCVLAMCWMLLSCALLIDGGDYRLYEARCDDYELV
jgi:hypothetical protein